MIDVFFYIFAATVIAGALGTVLVRSVVYAALCFIASLVGVAGVYILLSVEFLALVQVLLYAGAVTVLILFALTLTRVEELRQKVDGGQRAMAAVGALGIFGVLAAVMSQTEWPRDVNQLTTVPFSSIGDAIFNRWAVPFEIVSGVLLVALVGAIILAMQEEGEV